MTHETTKQGKAQTAAKGGQADCAVDFEKFIYLVGHDVRNSARALMEVPSWIKEDLVAEGHSIEGDLAENLSLLETHTVRLDRMLTDLLTFSRVGRLQSVIRMEMGEVIHATIEQTDVPKGFEIECDVAPDPVEMGEKDAFVLIEALLSNAIKHHDRDKGHIRIFSQVADGVHSIRVQDDGPGIEDRFHQRVFDTMTTLRPRDEVEGSGMGLPIARKIAEFYGGTIGIEPTGTPRGTTIKVDLPIAPDKQ